MGTVRCDRLGDRTSGAEMPIRMVTGNTPVMRVNFGNVVRESFNVSGATDHGTGDISFNFTNEMANDYYTVTALTKYHQIPNGAGDVHPEIAGDGLNSLTPQRVRIHTVFSGDRRLHDVLRLCVVVSGTLAGA